MHTQRWERKGCLPGIAGTCDRRSPGDCCVATFVRSHAHATRQRGWPHRRVTNRADRSLRESAESSIRTTRRELAGCGPSIPPQRLPAARNSRCRNTQRGNTRTTTARRWPKQQPGTVSRAVRTRRRTVRRPDRPRHPPRGRAPPDARSTCAGLVVGLGLCPPTLVSNTTAQGDQSVTPCNRLRYIPGRQPQDLPRRSA
jgi:hypothetical protein